jgi:hypothetical protein
MWLWPYQQWEFVVAESPAELAARLKPHVVAEDAILDLLSNKPFIGIVQENGFEIRRWHWLVRSGSCVFRGGFWEHAKGCRVKIWIQPSDGFYIVPVVGLLIVAWVFAYFLYTGTFHFAPIIVVAVVVSVGHLMQCPFYWIDVHNGRIELLECLGLDTRLANKRPPPVYDESPLH